MMGIKSQRFIIFSLLIFVSVLKSTEECQTSAPAIDRFDEWENDAPITDSVIKNSVALTSTLSRAKNHNRQHNLQLFNTLSCKGIFNNDAMTILTSMCDHCYEVDPKMETVQYYCVRDCFTTNRFELCRQFHADTSDEFRNIVHETNLIIEELSGVKMTEDSNIEK
ncbi:uncharacterized protein LOC130675996 [Microplitis mediator]|uniref:uncharacterized protein LOC130675996 n=1 Tax=Microplitis mediator TaxID=375433 RepID=UPI002553D6BD|nr:uncharacterized protein LOC130675996 [Microplitis mediator]